jgi:integrase
MARPKKDQAPNLKETHELSVGLIERLTCPAGVPKAFLRDKDVTGLRVRVTANGAKSFVFEAKLNGKAISRTLGGFPLMSIGDAKEQARELARTIKNDKQDPRELERQQMAVKAAEVAAAATKLQADRAEAAAKVKAAKADAVTVGEVWAAYIEERRPHWGDLHLRDHIDKAKAGGLPSGRRGGGKQLTKPGPLAALMPLALKALDQTTIERWAAEEGKSRPSSARLAWRLLTVFLTWCAEQSAYTDLLPVKNPAKTKKAREALGKAGTKSDVLQRGQLAAWFSAVQQVQNPVIAACLQMMLLTGARPGEVLALRWEDINTQWKGISIRDKVEGTREIPATPFMLHLLAALPRRNEWVFPSNTSASGCLTEPNNPHTRACKAAGLEGLTLHGLRRSFKSLTEWLEVPVGVVAQIQGHKPSATAEKHYTVRPLELLRVHHERIEAWILEQAGMVFDAKAAPGALRVVAA